MQVKPENRPTPQRPAPSLDSGDFTTEPGTGAGKTYLYLRTIF